MARFFYRPGHPRANERGFVSAEDVGDTEPARAIDAPIIADRIHEGTQFDGVDIGSRRKRREFLKVTGLTDASDFSPEWREGVKKEREREGDRRTKAALNEAARKLYQQGKWR